MNVIRIFVKRIYLNIFNLLILILQVGSTRLVNSRMILTSLDGSKLMWASLYSAPFEDYYTSKLRAYDDSTKMYYPGQTVICSLKALDAAEWITCTKEMSALRKKKHKEHKVYYS